MSEGKETPQIGEKPAEVWFKPEEVKVAEDLASSSDKAAEDLKMLPEINQVRDVPDLANVRLMSFDQARKEYLAKRDELFTELPKKEPDKKSRLGVVKNVVGNFTRMAGDFLVKRQTKNPEAEQGLEQAKVKVEVMEREGLLENKEFLKFVIGKSNQALVREFLDREVFKEVNCSRFLMIKGLDLVEFQLLITKLGYSPRAFFSDNRGENGGRIAIDNELKDGKHPLIEGEVGAEEMKLWEKIFPKAPKWAFWSKWGWSRNHGVVYRLKDLKGQDVLLVPMHVDPKNAVAFIGEVVGKKTEGKGALSYHQTAAGKDKSYIGTGLYDLGCRLLIKKLEIAKREYFKDLEVVGSNKLETTESIIEDDLLTQRINSLVVQRRVS